MHHRVALCTVLLQTKPFATGIALLATHRIELSIQDALPSGGILTYSSPMKVLSVAALLACKKCMLRGRGRGEES